MPQLPVSTHVRTPARDAQGAAGCLLWLPSASGESSPGRGHIRRQLGTGCHEPLPVPAPMGALRASGTWQPRAVGWARCGMLELAMGES